MKKRIVPALILIFLLSVSAGCGSREENLDGKWVIYEVVDADGTKTTAKEITEDGTNESYEFNGDKCVYTCEASFFDKPIVIEYDVVDLGSEKYELKASSRLSLGVVELKKDKLELVLDDGSKFIYKKEK